MKGTSSENNGGIATLQMDALTTHYQQVMMISATIVINITMRA